jgi:Rrf2 family protein
VLLSLSRKTNYALMALTYLVERPEDVASAREIAAGGNLPVALLMQIMKRLHRAGLVDSVRGVHGGYRLVADLDQVSLHDLVGIVDGKPTRAADGTVQTGAGIRHSPVMALHYRLSRFLKEIPLSDLVIPGRRIDVPLEGLGVRRRATTTTMQLAPLATGN